MVFSKYYLLLLCPFLVGDLANAELTSRKALGLQRVCQPRPVVRRSVVKRRQILDRKEGKEVSGGPRQSWDPGLGLLESGL